MVQYPEHFFHPPTDTPGLVRLFSAVCAGSRLPQSYLNVRDHVSADVRG